MRKEEFGFVVLPGNLKDHVRVCPLVFIFDEVELVLAQLLQIKNILQGASDNSGNGRLVEDYDA